MTDIIDGDHNANVDNLDLEGLDLDTNTNNDSFQGQGSSGTKNAHDD